VDGEVRGDEAALTAALRHHGVAERQVGQGGEDAAMAHAARVAVLLLDAHAGRDLVAAPLFIERADQRVERAQARDETEPWRSFLHRFAFFTASMTARARCTIG